MNTSEFARDQRVQTHSGTDAWASGDRYGTVVSAGRLNIKVKMDRSGRTLTFRAMNLIPLD